MLYQVGKRGSFLFHLIIFGSDKTDQLHSLPHHKNWRNPAAQLHGVASHVPRQQGAPAISTSSTIDFLLLPAQIPIHNLFAGIGIYHHEAPRSTTSSPPTSSVQFTDPGSGDSTPRPPGRSPPLSLAGWQLCKHELAACHHHPTHPPQAVTEIHGGKTLISHSPPSLPLTSMTQRTNLTKNSTPNRTLPFFEDTVISTMRLGIQPKI